MLTNISTRLQTKIDQAINGTENAVYKTKVILQNSNTEFKMEGRYLKDCNIIQDFQAAYTDTVTAVIDVTTDEYRDILKNIKDLECTLTFTAIDPMTYDVKYEQDPIILTMKVLAQDHVDLDKTTHPARYKDQKDNSPLTPGQANTTIPFRMNLIDPAAYELRHKEINTLFNKVKMEDVLYWICQQFELEEVRIIPPDNTQVYDNLTIPPTHGIATIFTYLQERYGIYKNGLSYYITNNIGYIYPAYDTKHETSPNKSTLHIINVPENNYLGLDKYHSIDSQDENKDIYMASVSGVQMNPLNTKGAENVGTAYMTVNADQMKDKYITIQEDGKVLRSENDISVISLQNKNMDVKTDMQNVKYKGETSNIYVSTSQLAATDGTRLTTAWLTVPPKILQPGHSIIYHYDAANLDYKTQEGRLMRVAYASRLHPSNNQIPWMTFTAQLEAKLTSEEKSEDEVQYSS